MSMTQIMVDWENPAEEFWHWVQWNEMPAEWQQIFDRLVDEPVIVSDSVGARFEAFVAGIPGWAVGPSHAREALIFNDIEAAGGIPEEWYTNSLSNGNKETIEGWFATAKNASHVEIDDCWPRSVWVDNRWLTQEDIEEVIAQIEDGV